MPPAYWFDRPLLWEVEIVYLSRPVVADACYDATGLADQFGCMNVVSGICIVVVADDLPEPFKDAVTHHELGHCHGWPADHPTDAPPTSASMDGFISNIERILSKGDRRAPPDP